MMSHSREPTTWSTRRLALYGVVLGLVVSMIHNYVHAFWSPAAAGDELAHLQSRMAVFVVSGGALGAAIAVIRNRLRRPPPGHTRIPFS